jgi:hypothetical protein
MRIEGKWKPHTFLGGIKNNLVFWKTILQFLKRLNNNNQNSRVLA